MYISLKIYVSLWLYDLVTPRFQLSYFTHFLMTPDVIEGHIRPSFYVYGKLFFVLLFSLNHCNWLNFLWKIFILVFVNHYPFPFCSILQYSIKYSICTKWVQKVTFNSMLNQSFFFYTFRMNKYLFNIKSSEMHS